MLKNAHSTRAFIADSRQPLDPALIEDRLTGTGAGAGGKTLTAFAEANGLDAETAGARLAASGLEAEPNETLKAIAERYSTRPIEVAKVLLAPAYRLPSAPVTPPSH